MRVLRCVVATLFICFAVFPLHAPAQDSPARVTNFDDLVAFEIDRNDFDLAKLKSTSWMIPTIAQWAAALNADKAYAHLVGLSNDALKQTCFQLWYPDEFTDALRYRGPAHWEGGITEAPIALPATAEEMREDMKCLRSESPVKDQIMTSAAQAGLPFLDFIGCRHFRTPVDPVFWQRLASILIPLANVLSPDTGAIDAASDKPSEWLSGDGVASAGTVNPSRRSHNESSSA